MKRLLATTALCMLSAGAFAADLPVRTAAPAPSAYSPAPAYSWTGFYAGVAIGWNQFSDEAQPSNSTTRDDGFVGGAFAGYNWQFGTWVVGLEADIEGTGDMRPGFKTDLWGQINGGYWSEIGLQGSVRARVGYAFQNILWYVTGGLAIADVDTRYFYDNVSQSFGSTQTGWTVGFGVEWAFYQNWIARMEYRYADFGSYSNYPLATWGNQFMNPRTSHDLTSNAFRVGLAYKFGGGTYAAPVLARY